MTLLDVVLGFVLVGAGVVVGDRWRARRPPGLRFDPRAFRRPRR
jgi:hypothetical protein